MMIKANVKMGLSSLVAAKQRSILALLGIVIGISSVIAMVSIANVVREHTLKQFKELGTDFLSFSKGYGGGGGWDDRGPTITLEHAMGIPKSVKSILQVSPMGTGGGDFTYDGKEFNATVYGVKQNFLSINRFKLKEGRFVHDLDQNMYHCVLGADVVEEMRKKGVTKIMGQRVLCKDRLYEVIGILEKAPHGAARYFDVNRAFIVPISTYFSGFEDPEISEVLARMKDGVTTAQITAELQGYFRVRAPGMEIQVQTAEDIIAQRNQQTKSFAILLTGIGAISLVVGGIGVMNVMLVSVTERRKEIGIRRALGALRRDIQLQFLIESLVLCFVGGLLGVVVGVGCSYFYAVNNGMEFVIKSNCIVLGVAVSTVTGIFFGYYPAKQAAKLDPIVALRSS